MENKLEEIKKLGNYAIILYFGENIGCDDLDVPLSERTVIVTFVPVGYLGSVRILYKGNVKNFKEFNFNEMPIIVPNPPQKEDIKEDGLYMWGTEGSINDFITKRV